MVIMSDDPTTNDGERNVNVIYEVGGNVESNTHRDIDSIKRFEEELIVALTPDCEGRRKRTVSYPLDRVVWYKSISLDQELLDEWED